MKSTGTLLLFAGAAALAFASCDLQEPPAGSSPFQFAGNVSVNGYIDVDGDGQCDDGDYVFGADRTVIGDTVLDVQYPNDFEGPVSHSGTVTVRVDSLSGIPSGTAFRCGANYPAQNSHVVFGETSAVFSGFPFTVTLRTNGAAHAFTGGMQLLVWGFFDLNGDGMCDDGDRDAAGTFTVNGNTEAVLGTFGTVSNSGRLGILLQGAESAHAGRGIIYGCEMPPIINNAVVAGNSQLFYVKRNGVDFIFRGGQSQFAGILIDANGNGLMDNGDYMSGGGDIIDGDVIVTTNYPANFTPVSGAGSLTVRIFGADGLFRGRWAYCSAFIGGPWLPSASAVIDSAAVPMTLK